MKEESRQENLTTIAVALGRVEEGVKGIHQQLLDLKMDTKEDISFHWQEIERLGGRITVLENASLVSSGRKINTTTVVLAANELAVVYLYYRMAFPQGLFGKGI